MDDIKLTDLGWHNNPSSRVKIDPIVDACMKLQHRAEIVYERMYETRVSCSLCKYVYRYCSD